MLTDENTRKYIDGSMKDLSTRRLEYDPTYNEYRNAPVTVLEYGAVYRDFEDATIIDDESELVRGNTISLTLLNGNLSRGQSTALSLEAQATSAPARTVQIEANETADPIKINIPSNLGESEWREMVGDEEYVESVGTNGSNGKVEIRLDSSQSYNLRVPQIGVGSSVPQPNATYATRSSNRRLQIDRANTLPVEVRDRYNNPVSGESVNVSVDSGKFENGAQTIESNTSKQGRPAARYFGGDQGVVEVKASFARQPSDSSFDPENNPADIRMNVAFDPRLDTEKPSISSYSINTTEFNVCTAFQNRTVFVPRTNESAEPPTEQSTILTCSTPEDAVAISVKYDVSDSGGSGLDYIELGVTNESGSTIVNKTHKLTSNDEQGTFFTPQIIYNQRGEPENVSVRVYDRNGLDESKNATLSI